MKKAGTDRINNFVKSPHREMGLHKWQQSLYPAEYLKKRAADRKAQEDYWKEHRYCEICLAEGRGKVAAWEVHEILHRSQGGKCEPDNEMSICRHDHQRAHFIAKPYLYKEEIYRMKKENHICKRRGQ